MKITKASVEEYIKNKPLIPFPIDGIPEGFSFREEDIEIGNKKHIGRLVAFVPLKEWGSVDCMLRSETVSGLLELYNKVK